MSTIAGFTIQHPRPNLTIDWDTPVGNSAGYAHAGFLATLGVSS